MVVYLQLEQRSFNVLVKLIAWFEWKNGECKIGDNKYRQLFAVKGQ